MYEAHFGFSGPPFQLVPDPGFFFGSRGHANALAFLQSAAQQGDGFLVVTGEIGAGKTTLVRTLLGGLDSKRVMAATMVSTQLESGDLPQAILLAFGVAQSGKTRAQWSANLEAYLIDLASQRRRALLIVDEAQNLGHPLIEELRLLSNLQVGASALLQVFLVGQPDLRVLIQAKAMEQLRQRVTASCHLGPLDAHETQAYVQHRLRRVGWTQNPRIEAQAYAAVHQWTAGIPRRINRLFNRVLLATFLESSDSITAQAVEQIARDLRSEIGEPDEQVQMQESYVPAEPPPPRPAASSAPPVVPTEPAPVGAPATQAMPDPAPAVTEEDEESDSRFAIDIGSDSIELRVLPPLPTNADAGASRPVIEREPAKAVPRVAPAPAPIPKPAAQTLKPAADRPRPAAEAAKSATEPPKPVAKRSKVVEPAAPAPSSRPAVPARASTASPVAPAARAIEAAQTAPAALGAPAAPATAPAQTAHLTPTAHPAAAAHTASAAPTASPEARPTPAPASSRAPVVEPLVLLVDSLGEYVKARALGRTLSQTEDLPPVLIVHTGSHSQLQVGEELEGVMPQASPDVHLDISDHGGAASAALAITRFDALLRAYRPKAVLAMGASDALLMCTLFAHKSGVPVLRNDAGRRRAWSRPGEEMNAVLLERIADCAYISDLATYYTLYREGIATERVLLVGNLADNVIHCAAQHIVHPREILTHAGVAVEALNGPRGYALCTAQIESARAHDEAIELISMLTQIARDVPVLWAANSLTLRELESLGRLGTLGKSRIDVVGALAYLDCIDLLRGARCLVAGNAGRFLDDAVTLGVPSIVLGKGIVVPVKSTEALQLSAALPAAQLPAVLAEVLAHESEPREVPLFWDGGAAGRIAAHLAEWLPSRMSAGKRGAAPSALAPPMDLVSRGQALTEGASAG